MRSKSLNTAFFLTTGASVVVFIYLIFLGYDEIKSLKDIVKIIASIFFPIPMLFFIRFILIKNFLPKNSDEYKQKHQKSATLFFGCTIILFILFISGIEFLGNQKIEDTLVFAHLVNSTTIGAYTLNYLLYNNLKVNGILSGVLLALTLHIFFI